MLSFKCYPKFNVWGNIGFLTFVKPLKPKNAFLSESQEKKRKTVEAVTNKS